jgi:hypothetical protein
MPTPVSRREVATDSLEAPASPASPAAEEAVDRIEAAHRFYAEPEKITDAFQHLGAFDLKHALDKLQQEGKLADVIGELSPLQRQDLLSHAERTGLISRQGLAGPLTPNTKLAPDFQRLLDDVNTMGPKRTAPLHYAWTGSDDVIGRAADTVRALQPGDSARLSAGVEVFASGLKYSGAFGVDISRDRDGKFRVGFDSQIGGGCEVDVGTRARLEGMTNGKVRLEYRYANAEDAMAAAGTVLATQGRGVAALGRPAAVEGELSAVGELMGDLGYKKLTGAEANLAAGGATSARLELDGREPELVLKSSLKAEASASLGAGLAGHEKWAFLNGGHGVATETRLELEQRFTVGGDALLANPKQKVTFMTEWKTARGLVESELSFELPQKDVRAFAADVAKGRTVAALAELSSKIDLDAKQERFTRSEHRYGGEMQMVAVGGGAELSVETRKRAAGE